MMTCMASTWSSWASDPVLAWMGQALFYGTLLAGVTWMFIRVLGRRIPSSVHGALWCIVLIKFVSPIGPAWSLSLESWCESAWRGTAVVRPFVADPSLDLFEVAPGQPDAASPIHQQVKAAGIPWLQVFYCIYAGFVLLLVIRGLVAYRRLRHRCTMLPPADASVIGRVQLACEQLGVRRIPAAYVTNEDDAPFVLGGWRPLLVLSQRHLGRIDLLDTVVIHEVAHLRRGDYIVRYIQWIAGSLLFFWPVVNWVNRQIDLARENACDEWALQQGKLSATDYARCLLDAVKHRSFRSAAYHPACMAANPAIIERRIEMILQSKHVRKGSAQLAVACLMVTAWGSFTLAGGGAGNQENAEGDGSDRAVVEVLEIKALEDSASEDESGRQLLIEAKYKTEMWFSEVRDRVRTIEAADADLDGDVSNEEITYYLAARALANPESVLDAYPFADLNRDGALSVEESLYFASGKRPMTATRSGKVIRANADGVTTVAEESGVVSPSAESEEVVLEERTALGKRTNNRLLEMHSIAGRRLWILDHGDVEPSADELADAVEQFEAVVAKWYFAAHPDADVDGDGRLTVAERTNHRQATALQEFLDRFPDADADADGTLTVEERDAFSSARGEHEWKRRKELEMIERARANQ